MGLSDAVLVSGAEASEAVLTSHPASKYVLDLLRIVTVDSLSLAPSKTAPPLVDILLEVRQVHQKSFQCLKTMCGGVLKSIRFNTSFGVMLKLIGLNKHAYSLIYETLSSDRGSVTVEVGYLFARPCSGGGGGWNCSPVVFYGAVYRWSLRLVYAIFLSPEWLLIDLDIWCLLTY